MENRETEDREVHYFTDYTALAFFWVAAVFGGVWQAIRQAPSYYRAKWRRYRHRVRSIQKERVDGLTQRERWLKSLRSQTQDNTDSNE